MHCNACNQYIESVQDYVIHLKIHFKTDFGEPLVCTLCKRIKDGAKKLSQHLRRAHYDKQHFCPDCGKGFILLHKLKIHILCHSQFAEFLCSLCGRNYKRKDKLREHFLKKHAHAQDRAEKSKLLQVRKQRLKRFRFTKLTTEEVSKFAYRCPTCCVGFNRRGILVNHFAKFHPDICIKTDPQLTAPIIQQQRSFKCLYCDRVYMTHGKRKCHILNCHPGGDVSCSSANTIELGLVEVKPHACAQCPRQFLTNAKLLQHQRKHHPEKRGPLRVTDTQKL